MSKPERTSDHLEHERSTFATEFDTAAEKVKRGEWAVGVIKPDGTSEYHQEALVNYGRFFTPGTRVSGIGPTVGIAEFRIGGQPGIAVIDEGHLGETHTPRDRRFFIALYDEQGSIYDDGTRVFRGSVARPYPDQITQYASLLNQQSRAFFGL